MAAILKKVKELKDKLGKKELGAIVVVLFLGFLFMKGAFVAVSVNGEPITRLSLIRELESQSGTSTLESLITKKLILQKAKREGVKVSSDDLQAEISLIEEQVVSQGQTLDDVLALQGMTRESLTEQIHIHMLLEVLVTGDLEASEDEVVKYLEENSASFPEAMTDDEKVQTAKDQIHQQKLSAGIQGLLSDLRAEASIRSFVDFYE